MRALVVYESMFGNTQTIAKAIAAGLRSRYEVDVAEAGSATRDLTGVAFAVVGGPTHAWGMSRPGTRRSLEPKDEIVSRDMGVREWLEQITDVHGCPVAAFDTRFGRPRWLTGSAARRIGKRLEKASATLVAKPESFFVAGTRGPLVEGEEARALAWGIELAAAAAGLRETVVS